MAIELNFYKTDDSPWGFRLTGGADCDIPLTVIKVAEGSAADINGLQVSDVVVRINDKPTADCTHADAHNLILEDEHNLTFAIRRDYYTNEEDEEDENNNEVSNILEKCMKENLSNFSPDDKKYNEQSSNLSRVMENLIAEAISGGGEVIPGQHVLGVNFNKVDLSQSTILKVMEDQHKQTQLAFSDRKWSAFLQKPDRPILKPKQKETEQPKAPAYKVVIQKQKRKNDAYIMGKMCKSEVLSDDDAVQDELSPHDSEISEEIDIEPNIDHDNVVQENQEEVENELLDTNENVAEYNLENDTDIYDDNDNDDANEEFDKVKIETPVPLSEQLLQVQMQLAALAQLPTSIQDTLESVTQQLSKILNVTQLRAEENERRDSVHSSREGSAEPATEEELIPFEEDTSQQDKNSEGGDSLDISERDSNFNDEDNTQVEVNSSNECEYDDELEKEFNKEEQEILKLEEQKALQQERNMNPVEEFHQRRLEQRPTNPLVPVQRPIILPGGRRWSQPDDALPARKKKSSMSDEKIIKTLDMYSENIIGHTKGINFMKYQPPPKNLDYLQKSEVYKLIHDMDPSPRGIASRPEMVAAEQDYYANRN